MVTALKSFTLYGQDYASGAVLASEVWTRLPDHRRTQMVRNRYVESSDLRRKVSPVVVEPVKRKRGRPRKAV